MRNLSASLQFPPSPRTYDGSVLIGGGVLPVRGWYSSAALTGDVLADWKYSRTHCGKDYRKRLIKA